MAGSQEEEMLFCLNVSWWKRCLSMLSYYCYLD